MRRSGTQINETDTSIDETVQSEFDWDRNAEVTPVYSVVSAVADATDRDPLELPVLADVIDPDALNSLFTSDSRRTGTRIEFRYAGCDVVVEHEGTVTVRHVTEP